MALADYLQPHERVAAECGHVAATNLRLIHYAARSGAPLFREFPYSAVQGIRLAQRPRITTVVLGALIAVLSLLAGPGSPLQIGAAGLGAAAVLLGIVFGDLSLVITTGPGGAKPTRWPLREVGRRESQELVSIARAAMSGEYDFALEPAPAPMPQSVIARSVLLLPADDAALTLAALSGEADVICLDLTTLVHPSRRAAARELVRSAVAAAARAGRRVWVRVSVDEAEAEADVAACVWPGLGAVVARVESAEDARRLEALLNDVESERSLMERVRIVVQVETAAGVWALQETMGATPRVSGVLVATQDALDLLGRPDARATWEKLRPPALPEAAHRRGRIAAAAAAAGVPMYACLATGIAPGGLADALGHDAPQRLVDAATAARAHGFHGAVTLHPEAIGACNAAFPGSPAPSVPQAAPAPSRLQPVVPSHFGIGVARAEAPPASATEALADGEVDEPVAPSVTSTSATSTAPSTAPVVWQPVVPSHFGIRVPPREPSADGVGIKETAVAEAPSVEES